MVAGHVIGSTSDRGLSVADDSLWRYFYVGLEDIRMPLFAALSGYVYAYRPIQRVGTLGSFAKGKARRLLVPLVTVGTLFFLTQVFVPGTNSKPELHDLWKMYVYGGEHLWFVQAMFLVFLAVGFMDAFAVLKSTKSWLIVLSAASALFVFISSSSSNDLFSVSGAIRLLPFFLVGYGVKSYAGSIDTKAVLLVGIAAFCVVYAIRISTILDGNRSSNPPMRLLELSIGLFAVTALLITRNRIKVGVLSWIGQYSFSVYLLHVFGSAGSRICLGKADIESEGIVFIVSMVMAVGLPIVFELTFGRIRWISWGLLGQRPKDYSPKALTRDAPPVL